MTLTQSQIAQCARVVTGLPHKAIVCPHGPVYIVSPNVHLIKGTGIVSYPIHERSYTWKPKFDSNPVDRSQALAVVEWLCGALFDKAVDMTQCNYRDFAVDVAAAVTEKDINKLQALVLELSEKS